MNTANEPTPAATPAPSAAIQAHDVAAAEPGTPAAALEWVDAAINELEGALIEAGRHVSEGNLDPALISAKITGLVAKLAGAGIG